MHKKLEKVLSRLSKNTYEFFQKYNLTSGELFSIVNFFLVRAFLRDAHPEMIYNRLHKGSVGAKFVLGQLKVLLKLKRKTLGLLDLTDYEKCWLPYYVNGNKFALKLRQHRLGIKYRIKTLKKRKR